MTRQINLLNPALRLKREWLTGKTLLPGLGLLLLALGLYGGMLRWENQKLAEESARGAAELQQQQAELTRISEELGQRKLSKELETTLQRAEAALRGRERVKEALDSGVLGSSEGFSEYLRALARQSQAGLWLVGLQVADGGKKITLEGRTLNPDQIPGYIRGLNTEAALRGRSFEALNVQWVGDEKSVPAAAGQTGQAEAAKQPPFHEFLLAAMVAKPGSESGPGASPVAANGGSR